MLFLKFSTGHKIPITGTLKYQMVNDMFQDDVLVGDGSYPISVKRTPELDRLMQFAHKPEVSSFTAEFENVELWDGTWLFRRGKLFSKQAGNTYRFTFVADFGEFITNLKGLNLKDLDFGSNIDYISDPSNPSDPTDASNHESAITMQAQALSSWPSSKVVHFPQVNPGFFSGSDIEEYHKRTYVTYPIAHRHEQGFINPYIPHDDPTDEDGWILDSFFSPAIYLFEVLSVVFSSLKIQAEGSFTTLSELKKLVILSFLTSNPYVEYTANGYYSDYTFSLNIADHMPDRSIADLLIGLKKTFRLSYTFIKSTNTLSINFAKDIFAASHVDWTEKLVSITNREPSSTDAINHCYAISSLDSFLSNADGDLNDTSIDILSSVNTVDDLPISGNSIKDVRFVTQDQLYYIWTYNNDDYDVREWQVFAHNFKGTSVDADKSYPSSTLPVASRMVTFMHNNYVSGALETYTFKAPYLEQKGNCPYLFDEKYNAFVGNDINIRFLFYRGMQLDDTGSNYYPYASADEFDSLGNVIGDYSLAWNGARGLYNSFHKEVDNLVRNGDVFEATFNLTRTDIDNLNLFSPIDIGSVSFVILDIDIDLPLAKPISVTLKKMV